ncbi:2-amino-4-hydroxy-6-hydroxymethyldihydropteridine diphosphokinase [Rhodococcus sp. X156]|uniref:2-amino-4-hydroxy-6- hydroxymethyldihydropteridine diphosphokinase n=1 Tax=Rhodococcus sp. X156 TaxID=2499145 RepID=UPI000FD92249|nr:2-amino-4-hydroxy-6-hydroxymethyldihydropteridine diphosphokinase [Rhodococcus sp. X156]
MSTAVLSIGSNLGDRLAHLQLVLDELGPAVTACSSVYVTAPWGGVEQVDFLNAVLLVSDAGTDCWGWLRRGQQLEARAHRERVQHWGPRSLDVDVLDCDGLHSDDPRLLLPHPRAHERAFVLLPWLEVDPAAVLTGRGPVADLLAALPAGERAGVHRSDDQRLVRA